MIKIHRDSFPPDDKYLQGTDRGKQKWRCAENRILSEFKSKPASFINGSYKFPKHPSYNVWKEELVRCQGKKCCYCEKPIDNGQIEHFRPKQGYQQNKGDSLNYPGYYWLAYRRQNLFLSCVECNDSGRKGNLFPIDGHRATNPTSKLSDESSILVNPYEEEPNKFISFYKDKPISIGTKGRRTIEILQLDKRFDLNEIRKDVFDIYVWAKKFADLPNPINNISQEDIDYAKERIRKSIKRKSRFSGMIMENIRNGIL